MKVKGVGEEGGRMMAVVVASRPPLGANTDIRLAMLTSLTMQRRSAKRDGGEKGKTISEVLARIAFDRDYRLESTLLVHFVRFPHLFHTDVCARMI